MYGKHVGSLEVVYENVTYFHEAGDKVDQWRTASITLTNTDSTKDQKVFVICIMTRTMYFKKQTNMEELTFFDLYIISGDRLNEFIKS